MCTVLYHQALDLLCKNRDKNLPIQEEIIQSSEFLAVRTKGTDYYSLGINKYGCAFVSTAVNTSSWTRVALQGRIREAQTIFEKENKGLRSPTALISKMLPCVRSIDEWIKALTKTGNEWMGYNVIMTDRKKGVVIETYNDKTGLRKLMTKDIVTNHFSTLDHGPRQYNDYPSSFERLDYCNKWIQTAKGREDIFKILRHQDSEDQHPIWRKGPFATISSCIIDLKNLCLYYTTSPDKSYKKFILK